jgi:hypothetical protein
MRIEKGRGNGWMGGSLLLLGNLPGMAVYPAIQGEDGNAMPLQLQSGAGMGGEKKQNKRVACDWKKAAAAVSDDDDDEDDI